MDRKWPSYAIHNIPLRPAKEENGVYQERLPYISHLLSLSLPRLSPPAYDAENPYTFPTDDELSRRFALCLYDAVKQGFTPGPHHVYEWVERHCILTYNIYGNEEEDIDEIRAAAFSRDGEPVNCFGLEYRARAQWFRCPMHFSGPTRFSGAYPPENADYVLRQVPTGTKWDKRKPRDLNLHMLYFASPLPLTPTTTSSPAISTTSPYACLASSSQSSARYSPTLSMSPTSSVVTPSRTSTSSSISYFDSTDVDTPATSMTSTSGSPKPCSFSYFDTPLSSPTDMSTNEWTPPSSRNNIAASPLSPSCSAYYNKPHTRQPIPPHWTPSPHGTTFTLSSPHAVISPNGTRAPTPIPPCDCHRLNPYAEDVDDVFKKGKFAFVGRGVGRERVRVLCALRGFYQEEDEEEKEEEEEEVFYDAVEEVKKSGARGGIKSAWGAVRRVWG